MKAEHINPFIISICKVMKDMCMINLTIGKPSMRANNYEADASLIKLGIVGSLTGEIILNLEHATALEVVSKMMMMPVDNIDEMGQSAISELGNMVAGNAATVFANNSIALDITPPSYFIGSDYPDDGKEKFSIPFTCDVGKVTLDVHISE